MLSKKHNDPLYWKNKLEALDCLPVDTMAAKNALWDKLHGRLQQKPADKKALWYWIAAGLLPLIIIALTMVNKTENMMVKHEPEKEKIINITPSFLPAASKETITILASAPVEKKQAVIFVKEKIKSKIVADTAKANEALLTFTALPENQAAEITNTKILPHDTTAALAVAKKKLQVVHINELEAFPAEFSNSVNYAQSIKPRKSKTNNLSFATQQNIPGFKIKLSSKN